MKKPIKRSFTLTVRVERMEDAVFALLGIYRYVSMELKSIEKRLDRMELKSIEKRLERIEGVMKK